MGKKQEEPEAHANHERWLVSYADFITLLFAFFVVLFSSSQTDRSKTNKMSLSIQAAFSNFSIFKDKAGKLNIFQTDGEGGGSDAGQGEKKAVILSSMDMPNKDERMDMLLVPSKLEYLDEGFVANVYGDPSLNYSLGYLSTEEQALARSQRDLLAVLEKKKYDNLVTVKSDDRGLILSLNDAIYFKKGRMELSEESEELLYSIGFVLSLMPNQIRIEGHTDNSKVAFDQLPSNWELASFRAAYVAKWLIGKFNMKAQRFIVTSYGQHRPISSNETEVGRENNNRVDIVILSTMAAKYEAIAPLNPTRIPGSVLAAPKKYKESQGIQDKEDIQEIKK